MTRRWILAFLVLSLAAALAENVQLSSFADAYGNTASFWAADYRGKNYVLLKLKSKNRQGDADFVFTPGALAEFDRAVVTLEQTPNPLKADGYQELWSQKAGDATVRTLLGRLNGVNVKLIQVQQKDVTHQICMDKIFGAYREALKKLKHT